MGQWNQQDRQHKSPINFLRSIEITDLEVDSQIGQKTSCTIGTIHIEAFTFEIYCQDPMFAAAPAPSPKLSLICKPPRNRNVL